MPVSIPEIQQVLKQAFPEAEIFIQDLVGDGDHLQAIVVSALFEGKSLLARHQMVYKSLESILKNELHALALKTYTPAQWESLTR